MRSFEPGLVDFAYYMGPLLFGLNKYVKEYPNYVMSKDMTLYRKLTLSEIEFHSYKLYRTYYMFSFLVQKKSVFLPQVRPNH